MSATDTRSAAVLALEQYASAPVVGLDRRLSALIDTPDWTEKITVQQFERPKSWRLVHEASDGDKEEMVFALQGSIVEKSLPPIVEKPQMKPTKYKYMRQSITIGGLGTVTFDTALRSAVEIFGHFDRQFSEGYLEPWDPTSGQYKDGSALEASNRYMLPRRDGAVNESIPFGEEIDPRNILRDMAAASDHMHTEDNAVLYFRRRANQDGKITHERVGPQSFRVGDIVEIKLSFVVVPLRGDRYKMINVLRSIARIDSSFTQTVTKSKEVTRVPSSVSTLKRKVTYEDEGDDGGKRSRKDMEIDQ